MPIVIETREEFSERHGGENYPLPNNGGRIFRDGAVIDRWGLGEPPTEPAERQRAEYQFAEAKLKFLIRRYQSLHKTVGQDVEFAAKNMAVVPPDPEEFELLEKWAAEIAEARSERDRLWAELPEARHAKRQRNDARQQGDEAHAMARRFFDLPSFST